MRPLARSYLQHGRRHGPFGSDPIPGIGQVPFASLKNTSATTVTNSGVPTYISMQDGVGAKFETSDADVFENSQNTGETGNPWGIKCLLNGTYKVSEDYYINGGTVGAIFATYHTIDGGNTFSNTMAGRTGALIGDSWDHGAGLPHTFFWELTDATDANPAPIYINPFATLNSGSNITVSVQTVVVYLGPYAGGNI